MYRNHYKLRHMPFQISPDPAFLWLGEKHKEALAILKYGLLNNQGFLLLTGDVGTGKTTLINALVNSLDSNTLLINIPDPRMDRLDLFKLIAHSLGLDTKLRTKFDFLVSFKDFLNGAHLDKKKVLLIIDEAQKLSLDSLEEIRLFSNIETQNTKLINVFLIGQDEFNDALIRPECRALRQRITIVYHIQPLDLKETAEYVKYRLRVAGTQREVFTDKAMKEVYTFSRGYPRLINILCDRALLTGYSGDLDTIDDKIIKETAKDLRLPGERRPQTPRESTQKRGTGLRVGRIAAAICLGIVLALVAYFVGSKLTGNDWLGLGGYGKALLGASGLGRPESVSGKIHLRQKQGSTPVAPVLSQPSAEQGWLSPTVTEAKNSAGSEHTRQDKSFQDSKLVVPFGYNTNDLPPESLARIDELAGYMLRRGEVQIVIRGYTDGLGSPEYNKSLSTFRANIVKIYLTGRGIGPDRMKVIGMGDAGARMSNATPEGRNANRRVEIELLAHDPESLRNRDKR